MKAIRLPAAILFFVSGILHAFLAFKSNTNNSLALWIGDGLLAILYLVLGVSLLMKKRFPFWLGIIPVIVSFLTPHILPDYRYWISAMLYIELIAVVCCMAVLLNLKKDTRSIKGFRWTLRGLSGLIIVFAVLMFIGESFFGENPGAPLSAGAITGLSIAGIGMIGLGLAWKWELIGSILALAGFIALGISTPSVLLPTPMLIWPLTALLFSMLWAISRNIILTKE